MAGSFSIDVQEILSSPRVRGAALLSLDRRALVKRRPPLSVEMVRYLEKKALADDKSVHALVAGSLLFMLYARLRAGDALRAAAPLQPDFLADETGFVDLLIRVHKTAKAGSSEGLEASSPIVRPALRLLGRGLGTCTHCRRHRQRAFPHGPSGPAHLRRVVYFKVHDSRGGNLATRVAIGGPS